MFVLIKYRWLSKNSYAVSSEYNFNTDGFLVRDRFPFLDPNRTTSLIFLFPAIKIR